MAMLGAKCSKCCESCLGVECPCTHAHAYRDPFNPVFGLSYGYFTKANAAIEVSTSEFAYKAKLDDNGNVDPNTWNPLPQTFFFYCDGVKKQGPDLLSVSFDPTCFGSGVAATVTAPGGGNPGPISSVTLTNKGSGYAEFGRSAPTLAVANVGTAPAAFTIELESSQDECGRHLWSVSSIAIVKAGEGYVDGQTLALTAGQDDTVVIAANGTLHTIREQPTLEVKFPNGSGATFTVELVANGNQPETWSIWAITFTGTTSGFIDEQEAQITGPALVTVTPALAYASTRRIAPALSVTVDSSGGVGATFTATLEETGSTPPTWRVIDLAIESAGVGYENDEPIVATVPGGVELVPLSGTITVNQNGGVVSVFVSENGQYYADTDELDSVRIVGSGEFYQDSGQLEAITITDGGSYYKTDYQAKAYVQTIKGSISPGPVSGSPTFITGKVDESVSSPTFGQVTSLSIEGSDGKYNGWDWLPFGKFQVEKIQFLEPEIGAIFTNQVECGCLESATLESVVPISFYIVQRGAKGELLWENDWMHKAEYSAAGLLNKDKVLRLGECSQKNTTITITDGSLNDAGLAAETGDGVSLLENGCYQDFLSAFASFGPKLSLYVDPCQCGACCDAETEECRDVVAPAMCSSPSVWSGGELCRDVCNPLP